MRCPVCDTEEFVERLHGSHAEDLDGSYNSYVDYTCEKCKGCFSVHIVAGKEGDIKTVEIKWKKVTPYKSSRTIA